MPEWIFVMRRWQSLSICRGPVVEPVIGPKRDLIHWPLSMTCHSLAVA